ncbi:CtsR family transcriptional regulator [Bacillus sp. RG28]|uniref:Transcriptional regulator CtsR n=1 Tax=Gottfriedia endophytica TaxID=2820819 RepID=A0A940SKF2_9BACI|nr:CtsR family transcriptional regulator [Gottfriedia endophytica]MBP0727025.1 CtsR family transcriptional regulator [Gottfriedia endophytica]
MRNISDVIEQYLIKYFDISNKEYVEIKRSEIATKFDCVPSQINYVINTRFTQERGYIVESKRGGGGYIRITKVQFHDKASVIEQILNKLNHSISQSSSVDYIYLLLEHSVISEREAKMMLSVIDRSVLMINLPYRDELRSRMLKAMLTSLKYK